MRGGKRQSAGRKEGSVTSDPRNVAKQIRWTHQEWELVKSTALILRMTKGDFQRKAILSFCKKTQSEHGFDK